STQTGSNDTVVLALTTKTNLVAIDDDSGAITMSKLNLASACNSCTLVVADYPGSVGGGGLGLSTLLWTSDTLDSDGDGCPTSSRSTSARAPTSRTPMATASPTG